MIYDFGMLERGQSSANYSNIPYICIKSDAFGLTGLLEGIKHHRRRFTEHYVEWLPALEKNLHTEEQRHVGVFYATLRTVRLS